MSGPSPDSVAWKAEIIYQQQLKSRLEQSHTEAFVAIEPVSGEYFVGKTLSEAVAAARKAHPDRLVHTVRVGHKAAVHLGSYGQD